MSAVTRIGKDNPPITNWSVQKTIEDMDKGGVVTAITSPTTPQVGDFPADEAARLARESNEYAKRLEGQHPGRFGTFAMLPLPYIEPSLREIEYAFDTLKVDGIGCMTNYGARWLGYADFEPIWPSSIAARQRSTRIRPAQAAASISCAM